MSDNISFTDKFGNEITVAKLHFVSIETVLSADNTIMDYIVRTTVERYSVNEYQYKKLKGKTK